MMIIDNRKVVAQYDDLSADGATRFYLAGNDELDAEPWVVLKYRRTTRGEMPTSASYFSHQDDALAFFVEMIKVYSNNVEVRDMPDTGYHY